MVTEMMRQLGAHNLTMQTGKLAKLADGAVVVTYGQTQVLATCVRSAPREGIDFFPLTIDVEERAYAAGKIPGSFFRREGRPGETAILTARLIDRPLRPTFKEGFRDEVQVVVTVLSVDMENPYDIPAMNAAACAVGLAGLPFDGPVAAVRLGLIDGQWAVNPTYQEVEDATFDIVVAGSKSNDGGVDILMIEGEAPENTWPLLSGGALAPTEEVVAQGLEVAKAEIANIIAFQDEFIAAAGVTPMPFEPTALYGADLWDDLWANFAGKLEAAIVPDKQARDEAFSAVKEEAKTHFVDTLGEDAFEERKQEFSAAWKSLQKKVMRRRVLEQGVRLDGRGATDIRQLSAEIGVLPRAHGSALFSRGETQVLNVTTLGMLRMTQMIDTLDPEDTKRYIHHYNFPPYSTGETGRVGSPRRREIGHGALTERALIPVVPHEEEFPYALRLVSDVMSSNGSTSMASVCGSTLSMMDAGVPLKAPVAGIAMGMIADDGQFVTLTDILGAEDALGDMDFKVAGTAHGVTAIQMDIKVKGITPEIMRQALAQAHVGRQFILEKMLETISGPREVLSPFAPRVTKIKVNPEKIGLIIGPGGKNIRALQEESGTKIDIQDDGTVSISSADPKGVDLAVQRILGSTQEVKIERGELYTGKIVSIMPYGAFVELLPGKDGLVHISELSEDPAVRVNRVEDIANIGDQITVMVTDVAPNGKVSLSRRAALTGELPEPKPERPPRRDGDRGPRRDDRGPRPEGNWRGGPRQDGDRRPPFSGRDE